MYDFKVEEIDFEKGGGLVPAIIQNQKSGSVLMLGYMNKQALENTIESGRVCFFSRSKNRLWVKGEISGNFLEVRGISVDCDRDTVLVLAEPKGPTCHLQTESCFGNVETGVSFLSFLNEKVRSISKNSDSDGYTKGLLLQGPKASAQKVGEEGCEVAIAAVSENKRNLISEAADLIYHLIVCLRSREISIYEVLSELRNRSR